MYFYTFITLYLTAVVFVQGEEEKAVEPPNIVIRRYEMCKEFPNTPMTFNVNIKKVTPMVFHISGVGNTPYPFGDNLMVHIDVETLEDGKWVNALRVDEKDPCKLLNDYVGETWYELEKEFSIPVGECPIAKGEYKAEKYVLDLEKVVPMSSIPKGEVRIQANLTQGDELAMCLSAEVASL